MKDTKRVGLLDEIRGFAIICMVVYHVMFSLKYYGVDVPIFFEGWFDIIRNIFAGTFIFISGAVCRFSRNNLKRGVQCFFLGMVITFVIGIAAALNFVAPGLAVDFGILHLLGISMMIYALATPFFDFVPPLPGIIIFGALFFLTFNLPHGFIGFGGFTVDLPRFLYDAGVLFPFGFKKPGVSYGDYFPLIPWFCVFAAGCFFGVYAKENRLPAFFYKTHIPFLAVTGRYTIWIYMLHQPIAFAVLAIIFS